MNISIADLKELLTTYLSTDYTAEEIEVMLSKAKIDVTGPDITIVYDNGVTETLTILYQPFLVQKDWSKTQRENEEQLSL